jgi:hypothetical protein
MPSPKKDKTDKLLKPMEQSFKTSIRKCKSETKTIREFVYCAMGILPQVATPEKYCTTLMEMRIVEIEVLLSQTFYLSISGMYRNAFHNIRYILESTVQSVYIDSRHKNSSLRTKIEILKEVEDKRDYRISNLISKLENVANKDDLNTQYKRLSQMIHPSHRSVVGVIKCIPKSPDYFFIDCHEISEIFEALRITVDMVLFLFVWYADDATKERLRTNNELNDFCTLYNMALMLKILKGKEGRNK